HDFVESRVRHGTSSTPCRAQTRPDVPLGGSLSWTTKRATRRSEIFGDQLEFLQRCTPGRAGRLQRPLQADTDMIVDQGLLGVLDRALRGLQLLSHLKTGPPVLDHFDNHLQMA